MQPVQLSIWILLILILIVLSALFSGSEVAYFSLSSEDLEDLRSKKGISFKWTLELHAKPKYLLSTLLLMNNLVNVAIIVLTSYLLLNLFNNFDGRPLLAFLVEVVLITSIILLFGEIAPKVYANRKNKESYLIQLWIILN